MKNEHSDKEIVDILYHEYPRIFNDIVEYLDNQD